MLKSVFCSLIALIVAIVAAVLLQATSMEDLKPYESPVTGVGLPPMAIFRAATKLSAAVDKLSLALKPPSVQIMTLVNGYQVTQAMGLFAKLHIGAAMEKLNPDGLSDVGAIAKAVGAHPDGLRRVLRMLASIGLVSSDGGPSATQFGNTAASKLLIREQVGSLWGAAIVSSSDHYDGWSNIESSVRKGPSTIAFDDRHAASIWEYYKTLPDREAAFAEFMTGISAEPNAAIAMSGANFSECGAIVDVGGGHGSLMAEVWPPPSLRMGRHGSIAWARPPHVHGMCTACAGGRRLPFPRGPRHRPRPAVGRRHRARARRRGLPGRRLL